MEARDAAKHLLEGARAPGQSYATAKESTPEWGRATGSLMLAQSLDLRMRMLLGTLHGMNPMDPTLPVLEMASMVDVLKQTYDYLQGVERVLKTLEGMYRRDLPVGRA